ncbi:MAG: hypothetical protein QM831_39910 [Kofleriaceae bacterium]
MRLIAILIGVMACAPDVPSARERADIADRGEAIQLEQQLRRIPGIVDAHVALHHAFRDPLTGVAHGSGEAILIAADAHADQAAISTTVGKLAPTANLAVITAPEVPKPSPTKWLAIGALVLVLLGAIAVAFRVSPGARRSTR